MTAPSRSHDEPPVARTPLARRTGSALRVAASGTGRGARTAAGASSRRVRAAARADGADDSGLSSLISVHALHAAGDALVTVALAGTLFFSVPIGEARSRVALYLLLTMLPFSLLVPVAGPLLDRFPHGRRAVLALTTGGRGLLVWAMATETTSLGLYPLALGVLVLSRAYGVARSSAVPRVKPPAIGLVSANARLNIAAVAAGAVGAGVGAAIAAALDVGWVLRVASLVLIVAAVLAMRLPEHVDEALSREARPTQRFRLLATGTRVTGPLASAIALRALAGLLTIFLAFLLRADGASGLLVGGVIGAAALGQLAGTAVAARLPERSSRLLSAICLALAFFGCLAPAILSSGTWLIVAAAVAGVVASVSKFSLDAGLQAHVPTRSLSTAFARAETMLQLAWVVGGALAVVLPTHQSVGFAFAAALPLLGVGLARQLAARAGSA